MPWAGFNLLELPRGSEHGNGFAMLSDILPTGHRGAERATVTPGKSVAVFGTDCGIEAVGYQAHGPTGLEHPEPVLENLVKVVRATGHIGVVGVHVPEDPGAANDLARRAGRPSTRARPSPRASASPEASAR